MAELTLESLGLTRDEILERVVDRIADQLLSSHVVDDDGDAVGVPTRMARALERMVLKRVDAAIEKIAGQHELPNIAAYVETLCLTETNKWGEKKGTAVTFIEYLVARADAYLREEVDFNGKSRQQDSFGWKSAGTRVSYLVHEHLQYSIQMAMQTALKDANASIVGGLEAAIKIKLAEVAATLKVTAKIG